MPQAARVLAVRLAALCTFDEAAVWQAAPPARITLDQRSKVRSGQVRSGKAERLVVYVGKVSTQTHYQQPTKPTNQPTTTTDPPKRRAEGRTAANGNERTSNSTTNSKQRKQRRSIDEASTKERTKQSLKLRTNSEATKHRRRKERRNEAFNH